MNTKQKGTAAERELIHMLWKAGWAAFRAAGSGSAKHACPDIIAGNALRHMGIECKISKNTYQYFKRQEIDDLRAFCSIFGAEAWVGIKFQGLGWFFLTLEDIKEAKEGYTVSESTARNKGLLFEELIG
ncbi:Holliday junction resolvase [Candidatus Woesearchaeota archaeon]|nr:Holliday junction resolvase [Candidatus Woesearchaeota archaeon]